MDLSNWVIACALLIGYNYCMFEQVSMSEIAQWTALVFLAGFIGFFGKSFGRSILSIFHKDSAKESPSVSQGSASLSPTEKSSPLSAHQERALVEKSVSDVEQKSLKKALKTQAKAQKKLAKK